MFCFLIIFVAILQQMYCNKKEIKYKIVATYIFKYLNKNFMKNF